MKRLLAAAAFVLLATTAHAQANPGSPSTKPTFGTQSPSDERICKANPGFCRIMDKLKAASPLQRQRFADCLDDAMAGIRPGGDCHTLLDK